MNEKKLKELVKDCEGLIEGRVELILKKVAKMKEYKEKYSLYSRSFQELAGQIGEQRVEELTGALFSVNSMEVDYIYLQGLVDGILLRENLAK